MHELDEKSLDSLEKRIPELASGAFKNAYIRAMASGSSVLEVIHGQLVESLPDGRRLVKGPLQPAVAVTPGSSKRSMHR